MASGKIRQVLMLLILILIVSSAVAAVKTFKVQETDLVKINAEAIDPDNDQVTYYYSPPLDENGEWQTGYDDAGEYSIEVTASDGQQESKEEIRLVVENKNQPPYVTENKITVKETQTVDLKKIVLDPDDDVLSYSFAEPFDQNGVWKTSYSDAGNQVVSFTINDGEVEVKARVEITVLNTNSPPAITTTFSEAKVVNAEEDADLEFFVDVEDLDQDKLVYWWKFDGSQVGDEKKGTYYLGYESSGEHLLKLSVTDGINEVTKEWFVKVENVNRKPGLELLPLTAQEGESVWLDLPEKDLDGDLLTYSFEEKFDENMEWQTDYESAGTYNIDVYVTDGQLTAKEKLKITVENVDRLPVLNVPESLNAQEGEKFSFILDTFDPDGDVVSVKFKNAPENALFNQETKEFTWTPGYDFIKRKGGMLSNVLNSLRLENFILKNKPLELGVESCSQERCVSNSFELMVYNTNRKPVFEDLVNVEVTETEKLVLSPAAVDPDGDIVRVTFSEPLGRGGRWKPDYDERGEYVVYVAATDGSETQTVPVIITVNGKNRQPTLKIKKDEFFVKEGQELRFKITPEDIDGDELSVNVKELPEGAYLEENEFVWTPSFDIAKDDKEEKGDNGGKSSFTNGILSKNEYLNDLLNTEGEVVWLSFAASDGEFDVVHPVKVTVRNVNQKPKLITSLPKEELTVKVGEPVVFNLEAVDEDDDNLEYSWNFGLFQEEILGTSKVERTFVAPGEKTVTVKITDGLEEIEKEWKVKVVEDDSGPELAGEPKESDNFVGEFVSAQEEATFKLYVIRG